jgi:nicotinic acid phosphoribosyltransferase
MEREVFDKIFRMTSDERAAERNAVAAAGNNADYLADIDTFTEAFKNMMEKHRRVS